MEFRKFREELRNNFDSLSQSNDRLFEVEVDKEGLWNLYLDSFPEGTNNLFRKRREYDCSSCKSFIRQFGSVVFLINNQIKTIWDFETSSNTFKIVAKILDEYIKSKIVTNIFVSKLKQIGTIKNYELAEKKVDSIEWHHFYVILPTKFINKSSNSISDIQGQYRDVKSVFKRSLDELTEDSILTVLELISSNSLYKGEEWKYTLTEFLKYKKEYIKLNDNEKDNYTWINSGNAGVVGKIRNHSIGQLLINISEGMELDLAVSKYESIVAPQNYKRPKAIYTKKMLEEAQKTIEELGFMDSLKRRYAILDDITINNILFANKDSAKKITGTDNIFNQMLKDIPIDAKKFSKVEEIAINDFIEKILPSSKELEVYVENKHNNNFVSLIAPEIKASKTMFKWNNNFSWAYSGNVTDSLIKSRVKSAGGKVDGVLRFSIQWNDLDYDPNDLDAHCFEPNGNLLYFSRKTNPHTTGALDIDIINPNPHEPAVENITWIDIIKMLEGEYIFLVHNYSHRGGKRGFRAEIEFNGQIYNFNYDKELKQNEKIQVARVFFDRNTGFTIKETLPFNIASKEIWNITTNQFIPVSVMCYSPNYWDYQQGIGNKHYMFMLKDCINSELPNGFYNEFLKEDLMKYKKVFEALGSRMSVEKSDNQLSGLGFSSTKRNDLIVKVKGNIERLLKIKF